jgi:DNA-binding transcriptional regulator YiaG
MRKAANILWGIVIAFIFFGFLFKFKHWPGASIAIILGYSLSIFALLLYFIARYKDKSSVKITTYFIYFFFFVSAFGGNYFSSQIATATFNQFSSIEQQTAIVNNTSKQAIKEIRQSKTLDKKTAAYLLMADEIISEIERNSQELVGKNGRDASNYPLAKANIDVATYFYTYYENGIRLKSIMSKLEALNSLGHEIESIYNINLIEENLEPESNPMNPTLEKNWADRMIIHFPLSTVLANFELLESRLLQNQLILVAL